MKVYWQKLCGARHDHTTWAANVPGGVLIRQVELLEDLSEAFVSQLSVALQFVPGVLVYDGELSDHTSHELRMAPLAREAEAAANTENNEGAGG